MKKSKLERGGAEYLTVKIGDGEKVLCESSVLSSLYKYWPAPDSTEYAKLNLEELFINNKMRLTGPSEINDPLDCNPKYISDLKGNQAAALIKDVMNRPATSHEFKIYQDELKARYPNRKSRRADKDYQRFVVEQSRGAIERHYSKQGFISFSADDSNPLLWAHYASAHKGVKITFSTRLSDDVKTIEDIPIATQLLKVRYGNERPKIFASKLSKRYGEADLKDMTLINAVLNKSTHWSYEDEWRFIGRVGRRSREPVCGNWVDIGKNALTSITLGVSSTDDTEKFIRELNSKSGRNLPVYRAYLSEDNYKILER